MIKVQTFRSISSLFVSSEKSRNEQRDDLFLSGRRDSACQAVDTPKVHGQTVSHACALFVLL